MARTIKAEKAQKINLMLSQAVTAMRVNERLPTIAMIPSGSSKMSWRKLETI